MAKKSKILREKPLFSVGGGDVGFGGELGGDLEMLGRDGEVDATGKVTASEGTGGFRGDTNGRECIVCVQEAMLCRAR